MSNFTFLIPTTTDNNNLNPPHDNFQNSNFTTLDEHHQQFHEDQDYYINSSTYQPTQFINHVMPDQTISAAEIPVGGGDQLPWSRSNHLQENEEGGEDTATSSRIAFRTESTLEVMDDGFKWRKYGKKKVKNSPNPRNYYKCSNGGCNVKKRVERDGEDPRFVITTYEGIHNHM